MRAALHVDPGAPASTTPLRLAERKLRSMRLFARSAGETPISSNQRGRSKRKCRSSANTLLVGTRTNTHAALLLAGEAGGLGRGPEAVELGSMRSPASVPAKSLLLPQRGPGELRRPSLTR